ncbi:STAS domain-containing protein, partial [Wohlfahrtiimonas larvae]
AMAALLFMVAWNMSEAKKVKEIIQKAPKGDIAVLLVCLFLTVFFDMIIAISIGVVLAALLFMKNIADLTKLTEIDCEHFDETEILYTIHGPLFFAAAERIFSELSELSDRYQTIILDWTGVTLLDVGGLQAFTRFMEDLDENKRIMICNVPFQPLKTLARAKIQPIEGRLDFYSSRLEVFKVLNHGSNVCIEVINP